LPVRATFVAIAAGAASGAALDLAGVAAGALLGGCAGLAGWLLGRPQ
jgi:hypothetical protein